MPTIDAQVHAYERHHPGRPWAASLQGPTEVTGDQMVAALDAVGVDGAILVSPFSLYRYDASYALEVRANHADRFALVKPVDPTDPAVAETIADWASTPGTVGVRIMLNRELSADPADAGLNLVLASAARHALPVNLLAWGRLEQARELAARNPDTQIVIDHLGLQQPSSRLRPPSPLPICQTCWPWQPIPTLPSRSPALARCRTLPSRTRTSGTHSRRIFDAFGLDRCLWGTDWTRATALLPSSRACRRSA